MGPISLSTIEFDLAAGPPGGRRYWTRTGEAAGIGEWRHPRLWRFWIEIEFAGVDDREAREHGVLATTRERAIGCLVRDLKKDERARFIARVVVMKITPPLPAGEVRAIEAANARLLREREAAKRPGRTQRTLAFA